MTVSSAAVRYREERRAHWDAVARSEAGGRRTGRAYQRRVAEIYRNLVPAGSNVLELGCGQGDLLQALRPARGVGVDLSPEMVRLARSRHPELSFVERDAHDVGDLGGPFDTIVLSDLLHDVWDVQQVLESTRRLAAPETRILINVYSRLWAPALGLARRLGWARPNLEQNWLTREDVHNLLRLAGLRPVRAWTEILLPLPVPGLAPLANRLLARIWPLTHLALSHFLVARPEPDRRERRAPTVSVVVPARDEAGNIAELLDRLPRMGSETELVFVEGHSTDGTYETIEREIASRPGLTAAIHRQTGRGKGDAVRLGFEKSRGEILMILDADLSVPPESLPRFVAALDSGLGEFVNGVRLVYPMERRAMRFANLIGNKLFSYAFTYLLGQPVRDTLCGTKVLRRETYARIAANRSHFGDFDPFGDFDLLFGAARLGLEIVEMPVRYAERRYGETKIQRWRHGLLLARMCHHAARKLKFV